MHFEINKERIRRARLWLAGRIAPAGADVHDPDETACPWMQAILEEACWSGLRFDERDQFWMNVTDVVQEAHGWDLVEYIAGGDVRLTDAGEQDLAHRWGPNRTPPWSGGYVGCAKHGVYETSPGEDAQCPECRYEKACENLALGPLPRWHWKRLRGAAR